MQLFARRRKLLKRAPRPEVEARKLLEAAAAAAITCNLNGRSPGDIQHPRKHKGLRKLMARVGFLAWLFRSPLGSPLRERIHLETLVFLSMDYCATAPDVVADVIHQV